MGRTKQREARHLVSARLKGIDLYHYKRLRAWLCQRTRDAIQVSTTAVLTEALRMAVEVIDRGQVKIITDAGNQLWPVGTIGPTSRGPARPGGAAQPELGHLAIDSDG